MFHNSKKNLLLSQTNMDEGSSSPPLYGQNFRQKNLGIPLRWGEGGPLPSLIMDKIYKVVFDRLLMTFVQCLWWKGWQMISTWSSCRGSMLWTLDTRVLPVAFWGRLTVMIMVWKWWTRKWSQCSAAEESGPLKLKVITQQFMMDTRQWTTPK